MEIRSLKGTSDSPVEDCRSTVQQSQDDSQQASANVKKCQVACLRPLATSVLSQSPPGPGHCICATTDLAIYMNMFDFVISRQRALVLLRDICSSKGKGGGGGEEDGGTQGRSGEVGHLARQELTWCREYEVSQGDAESVEPLARGGKDDQESRQKLGCLQWLAASVHLPSACKKDRPSQ